MVRYYDYHLPKDEVLNECREILLSLDYDIDMYAPESYALTTKSIRIRRTLRKYDYVVYIQVSDKIEIHIAAKRSIFTRGSETNVGKQNLIIQHNEDRIPLSLQRRIYNPITRGIDKKFKINNKISFY
tara:strand:- start:9 stop:392 length:384 start_codon:yes stop_codon:yes gene_type:complete